MHRQRLDNWLEKGIFGVVLVVLVYAPLATGAVRPFDFLVIQWLVLALGILWVVRIQVSPHRTWHWPPVCWGVLGFVLYAVGRYWTADLEYIARQELIRILVYALVFLAILQNLEREIYARTLALILIVLGMCLSFYAAYQFLTGSEHVWSFIRPAVYANRGSGTYICPNHLAGYLELVLPMGLAFMLVGRFNPHVKVGLGYASMMMFAGIGMSISRGGWAATGIMILALMLWLMRRKVHRIQAFMLLGALFVLSILMVFKVKSSFNNYGKLQWSEQWHDVRFLIWKPAWALWKDNPIWGVGPDHFDHRYRQYRLAHRDAQTSPRRVHNDYLNTLVDWGLVGAAIISATLVAFYGWVFKKWSSLEKQQGLDGNQRTSSPAIVLGGSLGLLALLVHSWVDFNMHVPANALTVVAWMAFVTAQLKSPSQAKFTVMVPGWRWTVTAALVVVLIALCSWTLRKSREVFWVTKAASYGNGSIEQMSAYAMAFATEPANYRIPLQLGECYRLRSWQGLEDYRELALEAITWFERSSQLNPYNPNSVVRHGMCLDWIGETDKADKYFERAYQLDPAGYYINALVGWHYMQKEQYAVAKQWFERSIDLFSNNNFIAWFYLQQVKEKLGVK